MVDKYAYDPFPTEVFCSIVPKRKPQVKLHARKVDGHNAIHNNDGGYLGFEPYARPRSGRLYQLVQVDYKTGKPRPRWELVDEVMNDSVKEELCDDCEFCWIACHHAMEKCPNCDCDGKVGLRA